MEEGIYKLKLYFRRYGKLEGIFIAPKEYIKVLLESKITIAFGECLGKHSNIEVMLDENDIEFITDDIKFIEMFRSHNMSSGINPFNYDYCNIENSDNLELEEDSEYQLTVKELVEIIIESKKK